MFARVASRTWSGCWTRTRQNNSRSPTSDVLLLRNLLQLTEPPPAAPCTFSVLRTCTVHVLWAEAHARSTQDASVGDMTQHKESTVLNMKVS